MDKPIEGDVKINENKWLWILIGECYAGKREAAAKGLGLDPYRAGYGLTGQNRHQRKCGLCEIAS